MSAVHDEYQRFLAWMGGQAAPADAIRVAKVVRQELDRLIPTVANAGQRATVLTPLLRQRLDGVDTELESRAESAPAVLPWTRLQRLSVGPFRGFRYEQRFDLNKRVVLFQGPNGSGKTSLCEALEFALLGFVEEAAAKRIDPLEDYFRNFHDGAYAAPLLWANGTRPGEPVSPNAELLRFALVEKNRIEGFARIAARRPAEAETLIATLFGLDGFSAFVRNFTVSLDGRLSFTTPLHDELAIKRGALADAQRVLEGQAEALAERDAEERALADEAGEGVDYPTLLADFGLAGDAGRLAEAINQVDGRAPIERGLRPSQLARLRKRWRRAKDDVREIEGQLRDRAPEVAFKELYEAVLHTREHARDSCPACTTQIALVAADPYARAAAGLAALEQLAELQNRHGVATTTLGDVSDSLHSAIASAAEFSRDAEIDSGLGEWLADPGGPGERRQPPLLDLDKAEWLTILAMARLSVAEDRRIVHERARREERAARRAALARLRDRAIALIERRRQVLDSAAAAREQVTAFDAANQELIERIPEEQARVEFERRIQRAYAEFKTLLERYNDQLPQGLLADLNELTRDLYNGFNEGDHEADKLEAVELPMQGGHRINIFFRGAPRVPRDALHALSEGHLRCLGLAIVLAKNIKLELPLLIFDDAVNAIDHDHRRGLRETLFAHPSLREKQLLITCHSPEFIKDVQNQPGGESVLYVLQHHDGNHQPRVINGTSRHYLDIAREQQGQGNYRQCLSACRQALENLTYRCWRKLPPAHAQIAVPLRQPDTRGDLLAVAQVLLARIRELLADGRLAGADGWTVRADGLAAVIGIRQPSLAYSYLNKGTHDEEDREDFEVELVNTVLTSLIAISGSFR